MERLATWAETAGFAVTRGAYSIPTAFEAAVGDGEFEVVVCAEYDALPDLGHGCGHNVIAASAAGAAAALAEVAAEAGIRVRLLGCPAEETGGGKVALLAAGAWETATVSLMAHPRGGPQLSCATVTSQAVDRFAVTYTGRPAHAASAPHDGINALDAATVAQVAVGLLRQQLPDAARVALVVRSGGAAINIIPETAVVHAEVRSFEMDELSDVKRRVLACFEAGAVATGCDWSYEATQPAYLPVVQHPALAEAWDAAMARLGRDVVPAGERSGGSTDMGNVTWAVPAIHPFIAVPGSTAALHTTQFRDDVRGPGGDETVRDAAIALAETALAVALSPDHRDALLAERRARGSSSLLGRSGS